MKLVFHLSLSLALCFISFQSTAASISNESDNWNISAEQSEMLNTLQHDTFRFFWETTNPENGLTPDRFPNTEFASVAGVGFALSAYLVGAENGYITRDQAAERTLATLRFLWQAPQTAESRQATGYKGFFYHFLHMDTGFRHNTSELSTIDTALLMAGVLSSLTYFDADNPTEVQIRSLADALYRRIEWPFAYSKKNKPLLSMGWRPENGHIDAYWRGYNEAMILYILALGSPTHPVAPDSWDKWTSTYRWDSHYDYPHVNFGPLFGHQYSQVWVDFREIQDAYMRLKGIDYFINSKRATYASRAYCIHNPNDWSGYGEKIWGLTACDGPDDIAITHSDRPMVFSRYLARGTSSNYLRDDGTIAPTAAGGSIPFAPEITIPTLEHFRNEFGDRLYGKYGFKDAFNLTYPKTPHGWFDEHYLAIDQGPILLMIENYRSGLIWDLMKRNPYIRKGLERAGFKGGWLASENEELCLSNDSDQPDTVQKSLMEAPKDAKF